MLGVWVIMIGWNFMHIDSWSYGDGLDYIALRACTSMLESSLVWAS